MLVSVFEPSQVLYGTIIYLTISLFFFQRALVAEVTRLREEALQLRSGVLLLSTRLVDPDPCALGVINWALTSGIGSAVPNAARSE